MVDELVEVVGALALSATAVAVVPQIRRVVRTGTTAGVSPDWALLGAISTAGWTAYTALRGLWWTTAADALACGSYVVTLVVLARRSAPPRWLAGAAWAGLFPLAWVVGGLDLVGTLLSIAFLVQITPSLAVAYRHRALDGVSAPTWALIGAEGSLWLVYGAAKADAAVTAFGGIALAASGAMLARLWSVRRPAARP